MPFDPDAFLGEQPAQAPASISPSEDTSVMPAAVQPAQEAFDPDKFLAPENAALYGTPGQQFKTFGEAFTRGFASQPIATGAEVLAGVPREDILGRQKENFWTNLAGELGGFGVGAFTGTGEAGLLAKVAPKAAAPIKALIDGFALTSGDEVSHAILQDPDQTAGSAAVHIGLGSVLSGAVGSVSPLWSAVKSDGVGGILNLIKGDSEGIGESLLPKAHDIRVNDFMKSAINVALGPSNENIESRVANLEAIRKAPEFEYVYDHILEHIQNVGDNAEAQNNILSEAKDAFKSSGYDAALASSAAKIALKDAQTQIIEDVTQGAFSKAPAVANAVELLRGQVVDASQKAYDILAESGKTVSLKPLYAVARELQDKVFSKGSPMALQQAEAIGKYVDTLGAQYGTEVSAENAKSIIKGLDDLSTYNWNATDFDKGLSPTYKGMRQALDSTLKDAVPAYRAAMKPLAEKTALLKELSGYGTEEDAVKSIKSLKSQTNFINDMPKLRDLEDKIGIKFTHDLDNYASPNLRELRISKLPEYEAAEKTANALAYYKHPDSYAALEHSITTDPEWLQAMEEKNNLKGLTETSLQGKMNSVMTGKNIAARTLLNKLPGLKGMTIPEILDLIAVRNAFTKGAGMSSRNTNLFGGAGASIGGLLGGALGGIPGASIGAGIGGPSGMMLGATIDKKGPAIAAKLLDKYVESFGALPEAAGLSERATRRALQFILGAEEKPSAEGFKAAADYAESASKGMSSTKKAAKAIFQKGVSVVPAELFPTNEKKKKLDEHLKDIKKKPVEMFAFGGRVGHYLPRHAESIAKIGAGASSSLNAERPQVPRLSPLDADLDPSMSAKSKYDRKLSIAEQPLMLFHHVKNGTITPEDVSTVRNIYPGFINHMKEQLTNAMTDHLAEDKPISHGLRRSIATMLEQPLDSTMTAPNMQVVIKANAPLAQAPQAKQHKEPSSSALGQINKVNSLFMTDEEKQQTPYNRGK